LTFMARLNATLANFLTEACDEKLTLTAAQMKELFKLGLAAVRQTQRVVSSQDTLRTTWRPSMWDTLHKKVASSERFKTSTALPMCLQMVKLSQGTTTPKKSKIAKGQTGVESTITAKRKADTNGDDKDVTTTRKAKRKKVKG
jgi:DNA polymerase phi